MTAHRLTQLTTTALIVDAWLILAVRAVWHMLRAL
jgi:hypothetical protein